MRFDFDAYEKVFPEVPESPAVTELDTAVEGFTPTKDQMAKDDKPGEEAPLMTEHKQETIVTTEEVTAEVPEGVTNE